METQRQAIRRVLSTPSLPNRDLTDRIQPYIDGLDLQANVIPGVEIEVTRKDGKKTIVQSDGVNTWSNFRTGPIDKMLHFDLAKYVDSIGSTGWISSLKKPLFVGFDFDHEQGHAEGVGHPQEILDTIKTALLKLDYVDLRRSTSGKGLHGFVWFDPTTSPTVSTRDSHTELAKYVLARMSKDASLDLTKFIDGVGGNLWFYSRRATPDNQGFTRVTSC
jgi:hypothetical protein